MKDIDVLYFYEHVDRELDVACAIKAVAEQQFGLTVEIEQHPYGELLSDLTRFRPRIVALPNLYNSNVPYALEWPEASYVNLMWEQIFYRGNAKAKLPRGDFALHHVWHHAWGDFSRFQLCEQGVPGDHVFVNGNPTYVLYTEPYRRYYNQRTVLAEKYGLDPSRRWVFFPENYNWAFYNEAQLQLFVEGGQSPADIQQMSEFCLRSFDEVARWCYALAQTGAVELIVRPRPSTPLDLFRSVMQRSLAALPQRLRLIKDESIREWIIASDVVVSSYSTSLIEAAVAGKPVYMLEPIPLLEQLYMAWHDFTPRLRTAEEFKAVGLNREAAAPDARLREWGRAAMMPRGDPIRGLAEFFSRLIRDGSLRLPPFRRDLLYLPPVRGLPQPALFEYHKLYRAYQRFRRKLTAVKVQPSFTYEKDVIAAGEVQQRIERWRHVVAASPEQDTLLAESQILGVKA